MTFKPVFLAGLLLTLAACATPGEQPPRNAQIETNAPAQLNATTLLNELTRVAALTGEQRRRELAALEAGRIDDARRFQAAVLLEREDSLEALERSLRNLNALAELDARAQALVDLMKKSLRARIELRQQTARAQELQEKLDQIKALEKSLQQRNTPPKTP